MFRLHFVGLSAIYQTSATLWNISVGQNISFGTKFTTDKGPQIKLGPCGKPYNRDSRGRFAPEPPFANTISSATFPSSSISTFETLKFSESPSPLSAPTPFFESPFPSPKVKPTVILPIPEKPIEEMATVPSLNSDFFYGDGERGENAQDFLKKVYIRKLGQQKKTATLKDTWDKLRAAFTVKWPAKKRTGQTATEK